MQTNRIVLAALVFNLLVAISLQLSTASATETKVQAIALFEGKAMLSINGGRGKVVSVGSSFKGIKLIESSTKQAIIEFEGQRDILTLDGTASLNQSLATKPLSTGVTQAILFLDSSGFFKSQGQVNGSSLPFIVDTGANLVVLSGSQADSIGLEYRQGEPSFALTASGKAPMFLVTLDEISFEGITLNYVKAGVIEGAYPQVPLLGMSFLDKVEMNRRGDRMSLKKR